MCHRDALVFASVPLHVRVVHVERASLVADILVAVRREICPVVPPEAFRLDACQAKWIQLVWPFGKQSEGLDFASWVICMSHPAEPRIAVSSRLPPGL